MHWPLVQRPHGLKRGDNTEDNTRNNDIFSLHFRYLYCGLWARDFENLAEEIQHCMTGGRPGGRSRTSRVYSARPHRAG